MAKAYCRTCRKILEGQPGDPCPRKPHIHKLEDMKGWMETSTRRLSPGATGRRRNKRA